ncbi:MAG: hypothetical protein GXY76_23575 [Chloroflexi bacterium]|nr:hypothetical protein [Chloroflexota bacterium]
MSTYWQRPLYHSVDLGGQPGAAAPLPWERQTPPADQRSLLQRQAALWDEGNLADGLLLRGWALQAAEAWAARHNAEVGEVERDFLQSCREAEWCARRRERLFGGLRCLLVGLAAAALVVAGVAWREQQRAERYLRGQAELRAELGAAEGRVEAAGARADAEAATRQLAEAEEREAVAARLRAEAHALALESRQLRAEDPQLAILLGVEAVDRATWSGDFGAVVEAREALLAALTRHLGPSETFPPAWAGSLEPSAEALDWLVSYACECAGRGLTRAEWSRYVATDVPYERACPALR